MLILNFARTEYGLGMDNAQLDQTERAATHRSIDYSDSGYKCQLLRCDT